MVDRKASCFTITLQSHGSECGRLLEFIQVSMGHASFHGRADEIFIHELKLVAEESLANIINHGYADDEGGEIEIQLVPDSKGICLTLIDSAPAYNPLEAGDKKPDQDFSQGGMGLILIKSLTDELFYSRNEARNVFSIKKHYNSGR